MIDEERIAEIEDRLSSATPGPWEAGRYKNHDDLVHCKEDELRGAPLAAVRKGDDEDWSQVRLNAEFIANAPADIAALIKALEEARTELVEVKAELAGIYKWNQLGRE